MYSSIKRITKVWKVGKFFIDHKIEREGFLNGDERVSF